MNTDNPRFDARVYSGEGVLRALRRMTVNGKELNAGDEIVGLELARAQQLIRIRRAVVDLRGVAPKIPAPAKPSAPAASAPATDSLECDFPGCDVVAKSKAGLAAHKRSHN
jgi:hypothetical protein